MEVDVMEEAAVTVVEMWMWREMRCYYCRGSTKKKYVKKTKEKRRKI